MALPTSETPITDVITAVQDMLTTVTGAVVPVSQVPSNLYSLLGVPPDPEAVAGLGGGATVFASSVDADALRPAVALWAPSAPTSDVFGASLGQVAAPATLGTIAATGLSRDLNIAGMAPLRPQAVAPAGARSFLDHVVSAVLVPASLSALAALALPGLGGLLIIIGAGMRVGYRQAKAALMIRASGIARYAGPGPLGVVRSGSLVALHVRPARPVEPDVSRPARILERVA